MWNDLPTPIEIIFLSARQLVARIPFWIRVSAWGIMLALPIFTWPAARAGLYHTIRAGLRDPFETEVKPRQTFLQAFALHFRRSTILTVFNLLALFTILYGIVFWLTREQEQLRYVSAVAIYFLFFWWLCQPFLMPIMVENPELSPWQVYLRAARLVFARPIYAFVIAWVVTFILVVFVLLTGPLVIVVPPAIALISIQAFWAMTGVEIPDRVDPVEYANRQAKS